MAYPYLVATLIFKAELKVNSYILPQFLLLYDNAPNIDMAKRDHQK